MGTELFLMPESPLRTKVQGGGGGVLDGITSGSFLS
jgi:hypothetical protein